MIRKLLLLTGAICISVFQAGAEETCVTSKCHADVKKYEVLHAPVEADECTTCHIMDDYGQHVSKPAEFREFSSPAEDGPVCLVCHDEKGGKKFVHAPVEGGDCTACHNPHGGTNKYLLITATESETCFQCHENDKMSKKFLHGPVGAGECASCHDPHSSDNQYQLKAPKGELCFVCHSDKKADLSKVSVHAPVADDCTQCHDPHNSDTKFHLKAADEKALCLTCHGDMDPAFKENILTAQFKHQPVEDGSCGECHNPHASDFGQLLRSDTKQICFECHQDLGKVITGSEYVHAPVEFDGCNACHNVHGSGNPFILYEHFPKTFYNQYTDGMYKICYECHDTGNLESAETDGTGFRNGKQNLHYLHVMIPGKGRSCKACHEVHASNQPLHIRNSVPFGSGGWELPIKFTRSDNGGTCVVGCHKPKTYDRTKEFQNP
ncbi:MAG: cytochrome c3 family protein [Deferribacterales bacterium]